VEVKKEKRERVRKYAGMAKKAMEEGGSSYCNMSMLIDDIIMSNQMHIRVVISFCFNAFGIRSIS